MDPSVIFPLICLQFLFLGVSGIELLDEWALQKSVQKGDKVDLRCNYKLEGENMYSLKWYWDNVEFYRYIPTEEPSTTVFVMPGLEVLDKSTPTHIILNNAVSDTSGVFKCEVSAGPPRFSTASRTTQIQIVDLPTSKPHIYGLRSQYNIGSLLNLSCESGPSSPPPVLHWFINGVRASAKEPERITNMDPVFPLNDKRGISRSMLNWHLIEEKLPRHPIPVNVKCVAVIKEFYRKSVKVQVKVLGRKKFHTKDRNNVIEDDIYEDWTTENWEDDFGSNSATYWLISSDYYLVLFTYLLLTV